VLALGLQVWLGWFKEQGLGSLGRLAKKEKTAELSSHLVFQIIRLVGLQTLCCKDFL